MKAAREFVSEIESHSDSVLELLWPCGTQELPISGSGGNLALAQGFNQHA